MKKDDLPKKFFKIGKVYRNEALDWKHLFEFYQVEGIVVDKNANFRHLLGYLVEFYKKLGHDKIRIRPANFPYTEPSVEVEFYNKDLNQVSKVDRGFCSCWNTVSFLIVICNFER